MSPLTNRCTSLLRFDADLPRWPGELALAVMHDGIVVIRDVQAIDTVGVFGKLAPFV